MESNRDEIYKVGESLLAACTDTVNLAKEFGADDAKCVGAASIAAKLVVEAGEFSLANTLSSQSLGVLVHKDMKKGSASTNSQAKKDREHVIKDALTLASFSIPDKFLTLADGNEAPLAPQLPFLVDSKSAEIGLGGIGEIMKEVLAVFKEEPRFALDRFEVSSHLSFHGLVNSRGVSQKEFQTTLNWDYLGMAKDGDQVSGMDYEGGFSFKFEDPREKIIGEVKDFIGHVVAQLNPVKSPSYVGPVLIAPRALSELLLSPVLFHTSGRAVMDDKSRWDKSIGEEVISELITIKDNPHDPTLVGATAYDSDGLPTHKRTIIDKGVLKTHLHDCYSAKKMGQKSTATSGGPFCLSLEAGDKSFKDLLTASKDLLYVTRFSGNVDALTGDFSGVAKSSRLFRNGEDVGAIGETMIAGNVFEMAKSILGVNEKAQIVSGSFKCPDILIDGISVS